MASPRAAHDHQTPLIGRADLVTAIAQERVVVLVAQPGAGKSRLLAELRAVAPEPIVATVRCHRGVVASYEPLEALIEAASRAGNGTARSAHRRAPADDADRLVSLRERLEVMADATPMLLQIDDIHWAPQATLDAIAFCIDRTRDSPIRWQFATRQMTEILDPVEALRREPDCRVIDLPLLDAEQTSELARILGADASPDLHRLTGGNPLYVEQWLLARSRPGSAATLRSTLEVRVGDIPARGAEIAAAIALAERPLTLAEIVKALGKERVDVRAIVDDLEALGILRLEMENESVEFVHDLLRGACVGMLDTEQRTAIREKLVAIARDDVERGGHLVALNRTEEAACAYSSAARSALANNAFAEAKEIADRLRSIATLSDAMRWQLTAIDAIVDSASHGLSLSPRALDALLAARTCVDVKTCAFYLERIISIFVFPEAGYGRLIVETMIETPDIAIADVSAFYVARTKALYGEGKFAQGLAIAEMCLAAEGISPADAFELRCMRALFRGMADIDAARAELTALVDDPSNRELASYETVFLVFATLEDSYNNREQVMYWAKRGIAWKSASRSSLYFYWAWAAANLGDLSEAIDAAEAGLAQRLRRGATYTPSFLWMLVETYAWTGRFARARELVEAGERFAQDPMVRKARGTLAELEGNTEEALRLYALVADDLASGPNVHGAQALAGIVRIASLRADMVKAREAHERLVSGTSQTEFSWCERAESEFYIALAVSCEADVRRAFAQFGVARVPVLPRAVALAYLGERYRDRDALFEATAHFERSGATEHEARTRRIAQSLGFRFGSKSVSRSVLNEREAAIARLIASGKTNREIADALHVSPKTIAANIGSMLERYGLRSRVEIASRMASGTPFERVLDLEA
jgi:DNA-binding NarL/FixJ family response regulator